MIGPVFRLRCARLFALLIISLASSSFLTIPEQTSGIILHDEALPVTPKEFYVALLVDERADKTAIAWLIPPRGSKTPDKVYAVDLQGGTSAAISRFVANSFVQNKSLRPVVLNIKAFAVTETLQPGGQVAGLIAFDLSFGIRQGDDLHQVYDYKGEVKYVRNAGTAQDLEPTLRKVLINGLTNFNVWMNKQAATDIKLAKSVTVSFSNYTEKPEGDTVYYTANRPLTWDDFKGKIPGSRFAAEVYPSMGYDEHTDVVDGVIHLNIGIKVFLPKSAAWAREGDRTDYILNHEQRHFDIAKIAAEHFKQKIKAENLGVTNFDGPINEDYLDAYRDMTNMELQYDKETGHGADRFMQEKWNEKIDRELRAATAGQ